MNETIKYTSGRNARRDNTDDVLKIPSPSCGLTAEEAEKSKKLYGKNLLSVKKQDGFFRQFLRNLNDPIIKILICALVINTAFMFSDRNWAESAGIALTVFISAFVTTLSEHSSGSAFEKLYSALGDTVCHVLRGGIEEERRISEIVKYDIVSLYPGDMIPADGILLRGAITCDESPLTGESREVRKWADDGISALLHRQGIPEIPMKTGNGCAVFRGSHVSAGNGVMLVTAVGDNTVYGSIATELSDGGEISPLKTRLSGLARTISKIGYISAGIVAAVHLADAFWFDAGQNPVIALERLRDLRFAAAELVQALTMAISVVVVAVPEGLPMMITVVLSSNMKKMLKSGVLVRRLVGIETAGSVDILFTDKTGTLTTGKLTVSEIVTGDGGFSSCASLPQETARRLREGALSCSSVFNPTERAIHTFLGLNSRRTELPDSDRIPFDSDRKYAAAKYNGKIYIRGAAEYILPYCTSRVSSDGRISPADDEWKNRISEKIRTYAGQSCRILLQAEGKEECWDSFCADGFSHAVPLTFTALFIIRDEVRKEVLPAVTECCSAGIKVVMLTGDNDRTAAGIAAECGILPENYRIFDKSYGISRYVSDHASVVIDGQSLKELTDAELTELLP
ncbi:MAG: HAD family hydrolase, partial [Clostridia bacterium]|nr:HAD family hydrolase [Clostridia bacterium]